MYHMWNTQVVYVAVQVVLVNAIICSIRPFTMSRKHSLKGVEHRLSSRAAATHSSYHTPLSVS